MFLLRILRRIIKIVTLKKAPKIVIFLYMIQDLDLALILSDFLLKRGLKHKFIVTKDLARKSPRVVASLQARNAHFSISKGTSKNWFSIFLLPYDALFTVVETSADAHRAGYILTLNAKRLGLKTYTLQHGLENIGLTYFDEKYSKDNIRFASDTIFIWCDERRLHPDIHQETKRKCLKVGSLKSTSMEVNSRPLKEKFPGKKIVSIFENLHWERYNEEYRLSFVENVQKIAKSFPDILFVIKPHHAGQWLTRKYKGSLDWGPNVIITNPSDPVWEPHTGPDLIDASLAVITTPSTITLDAALLHKPVAIFGKGLELSFYKPLPILTTLEDWVNFVHRCAQSDFKKSIDELNSTFVNAVTTPGNTSGLITDKLISDFSQT